MSRDSNSLATDRQDRGAGANIPKPSKKDRNQLKTRGDFYILLDCPSKRMAASSTRRKAGCGIVARKNEARVVISLGLRGRLPTSGC